MRIDRRDFLKGSVATGALAATSAYASQGSLSGRVVDMFSNQPYGDAVITLVNDFNGEVYKTKTVGNSTVENPTAVRESGWAAIKREFKNASRMKPVNLEKGAYDIEVPNGVYSVAITDSELPAAKPTESDLYGLGFDPDRNMFVPRVFKIDINGDTRYDEMVLGKGFDLEYGWTVMRHDFPVRTVKHDIDDTVFYIDTNPAREDWAPNLNGKKPTSAEIDMVERAIHEFVELETDGKKIPNVQIGTNPPRDDFVNPENGGLMIEPGYALFFWDSELGRGIAGIAYPTAGDDGLIISSDARVIPGANLHTIRNEILGAGGLGGEPGTRRELDRRIRDTGSSVFLDGGTDDLTERDKQFVRYHGMRPANTRPKDITDRVVNS